MKHLFKSILLLSAFQIVISCSKDPSTRHLTDGDDPAEPVSKAYTINGSVKDASGNPVKNARIRVENPTGNNIHYTTRSDESGKYAITVSAIGGYKIYAWKEVEAEGQIYQVRLGMDTESDYDAFSVPASGVVKNFVWKLSGRIPDRTASPENGTGYFGGTIKVINYNDHTSPIPAGTQMIVKLTPKPNAVYLDGTVAANKVMEKRFNIANGVGQAYYITDIPATHYTITISSVTNGIHSPVGIGSGTPDIFSPTANYYFKSEGGSGSYESGLASPNEYSFYMKP